MTTTHTKENTTVTTTTSHHSPDCTAPLCGGECTIPDSPTCDTCGLGLHTDSTGRRVHDRTGCTACEPADVEAFDRYTRSYECPTHGDTLIRADVDQPEPMPSMTGAGWDTALHLECGCTVHDGPTGY